MKKTLFIGALALFGVINAQENLKGKKFVSGSIGYNSSNTNNTISTTDKTFLVAPQLGYFVTNDIAIGLGIGFQDSSYTAIGGVVGVYKTKRSGFFISPFVRKYWSLGEKLNFFGQLSASYSLGNQEIIEPISNIGKTRINSYGFNLTPGLDYSLNNHWSLLTSLGYIGFNSVKPENSNSTSNFNFGIYIENITFGTKYTF